MENEKDKEFGAVLPDTEGENLGATDGSSRARNRTVMLTPEITGQVRARLGQDFSSTGGFQNQPVRPSATLESGAGSGFMSPRVAIEGARPAAPSPATYGTPQLQIAPPSTPRPDGILWSKLTPILGFLVSFDNNPNGDVYELRSGRVMVTSESSAPENCLIVKDDTVSPMHAIIRISPEGDIQVLDQLSEHGTKIKKFGGEAETELSGERATIEHGDSISFGNRKFNVCLIAK